VDGLVHLPPHLQQRWSAFTAWVESLVSTGPASLADYQWGRVGSDPPFAPVLSREDFLAMPRQRCTPCGGTGKHILLGRCGTRALALPRRLRRRPTHLSFALDCGSGKYRERVFSSSRQLVSYPPPFRALPRPCRLPP